MALGMVYAVEECLETSPLNIATMVKLQGIANTLDLQVAVCWVGTGSLSLPSLSRGDVWF